MPKEKRVKRIALNKWMNEINDKHFIIEGDIVNCQACNKQINCHRKSQLTQHANTTIHKQNTGLRNNSGTNGNDRVTNTNQFYNDMYEAMVAAKIPWRCLSNVTWRNFLEKYTDRNVPNEITLVKKNYLQNIYLSCIRNIRKDIDEYNIWISINETTDSDGRFIINLVVGKMCEKEASEPHLLACKKLEKTNYVTIAKFVDSSIRMLWSNGENNYNERVLFLITNVNSYMLKAGQKLKIYYPKMLHLTCLLNGINKSLEEVRFHYFHVSTLISAIKQVFLQSPHRITTYKDKLPNVPLPPQPVITRWVTWLEAALFYAKYLNTIREVIMSFHEKDISIRIAKEILEKENLNKDLINIEVHYENFLLNIPKLENQKMTLTESMGIIKQIAKDIDNIPGLFGRRIKGNFINVLQNNPGYYSLSKIEQILNDTSNERPKDTLVQYWNKFKYVPITSCDVTRLFPVYKLIFSDKRYNYPMETFEKMIIIYCNVNYD
ncbi:hypothetical protein M0804_007564 [Polistes exclamans]|nr:hypothetical protein M0804_007564 [Polistes exclamans]